MIATKYRSGPLVRSLPVVVLLALAANGARAEKMPPLWGYGVKSCSQYLAAGDGDGGDGTELRRYKDWLTGLVSGLNLATGMDVLKGVDIDTAMRRIRAHCRGNRQDDFFTAAMDLVRMLSNLR
jgi:hypothetical protein